MRASSNHALSHSSTTLRAPLFALLLFAAVAHARSGLEPAHGLRQYAADEALETAGFEVQGISFNAACMSQGCWELDVKYSLATKAMSVLYLPRTDGDDTLTDGGGYPASVESTFEPKLFPCGLMGAGRVDACCIKELMQSYRTPSAFEAHMASVDFSLCPSTPLSSQVLGDLDAVSKFQFIQGDFVGMPESEVNFTSTSSHGRYGFAKIRLDEKEVRTLAGKLEGHAAVEYTVNTFVGMVSFVPILDENGEHSTFMQIYHSQTPISLMKKNKAQVVLNGGFSQTFLNYVGTVLHNVRVTEGAHANANAQFIQVSFTMPERYTAAGSDGQLIPFESVRFAKGSSVAAIEEWQTPCLSGTESETSIYGDQAVAAVYDGFSQEVCAPPAGMCSQPTTNLSNSFVSYQFPLGLDFYDNADMTSSSPTSIFLEFVVSVEDDENKLSSQTAMLEIPLKESGHVTWCEAETASTDLLNIANVDIVIGTASSQGQLDQQLQTLSNVMYSEASTDSSANSLQSGLMTVVLKGQDSFFELPAAQEFSLELEDLITIHILETTTSKYDAVSALLEQGLAFETTIEGEGAATKATINPTHALTQICPEDGSDMACVVRRDVHRREGAATAMELDPSSTVHAKAYMQNLLSTTSAWVSSLGSQFSSLLAAKYDLNSRSKRAWWINPGHKYGQDTKYTLCSRIIVGMLINLNEQGAVRRREMIVSDGHGSGSRSKAVSMSNTATRRAGKANAKISTTNQISYNVNPAQQMISALGVDQARSTTFLVSYDMPKTLLCLPDDQAKEQMGKIMLKAMLQAGDVENVIVMSIGIPPESRADCNRRTMVKPVTMKSRISRGLLAAGPAVSIEMLVVFRSEKNMVFNQAAFMEIPGMLSIEHTDAGKKGKMSIDDTYVPPRSVSAQNEILDHPAAEVLAAGSDSTEGESPYLSLLMGCAGAAAVMATASALIMRRRTVQKTDVKDKDMQPVKGCQDKDELKFGPNTSGVRLRRSTSNEEMARDQEMGVKTLERSSSGEALVTLAFAQDSFSSKASLCFAEGDVSSTAYSTKSSSSGTLAGKTPQERMAFIKGQLHDSAKGPSGPASVTASSTTASASQTCSNTPQKSQEAVINLNLDVIDWTSWRDRSPVRSPERSPEHSRCTSPLLRRGDLSPEGSFKAGNAYRGDRAARELRKEKKLQSSFDPERLAKAFDLPTAAAGPEGKSGSSVTEIKDALRSLGVTEQDILKCMEKSDLKDLLASTLPALDAPCIGGDDVESRLFRTQSCENRAKATLNPSKGM